MHNLCFVKKWTMSTRTYNLHCVIIVHSKPRGTLWQLIYSWADPGFEQALTHRRKPMYCQSVRKRKCAWLKAFVQMQNIRKIRTKLVCYVKTTINLDLHNFDKFLMILDPFTGIATILFFREVLYLADRQNSRNIENRYLW